MLIDTHCHIHDPDYPFNGDEVISRAHTAGVMQMICVGTNEVNSNQAIQFALDHDGVFASVGVHPHYAVDGVVGLERLVDLLYSRKHLQTEFDKAPGPLSDPARSRFLNERSQQGALIDNNKLVAIGEIGLDYHYNNSPRADQIRVLKSQINLALQYDLPIIFHVRGAFDDFWEVLDSFQPDFDEGGQFVGQQIRGVLHCFTDSLINVEEGLKRGLYIGINGISTFTKDESQKSMFRAIPLDKILLETDAPYLTPAPLRGKVKINEPAYIKNIAEYNSDIYNVSFNKLAEITTANAKALFKI
jgi:TatD DNase family protein